MASEEIVEARNGATEGHNGHDDTDTVAVNEQVPLEVSPCHRTRSGFFLLSFSRSVNAC